MKLTRALFYPPILLLLLTGAACRSSDRGQGAGPRPAASRRGMVETGRRAYPYSVVSGGVESELEIRRAVATDRVVALHYKDLRVSAIRPVRLAEPRRGYVSYRIGDRIYWTRRMVTLQPGELVLTDGESWLRGRCGNRIAAVPMDPVAAEADEPEEKVLDQSQSLARLAGMPPVPEASVLPGRLAMAADAPVETAAGTLLPPVVADEGMIPWGGPQIGMALFTGVPPSTGAVGPGTGTPTTPIPPDGGNPGVPGPPLVTPPGGSGPIVITPPAPAGEIPPPLSPRWEPPVSPQPPPSTTTIPPFNPPSYPPVTPENTPPYWPPNLPPTDPPWEPPTDGPPPEGPPVTPPPATPPPEGPPVIPPPETPPTQSIPEPATITLIATAAALWGIDRVRRRRG